MPSVFVTGATGNIGAVVVEELRSRGLEVTALVRRRLKLPGCRTVVGDLASIGELQRTVAKADHLIHLASPRSDLREAVVVEDILGTGRLIDLWRRGNFVYVSSSTVYGVPPDVPLTENHAFDPVTWYDLGKVTNEYQIRFAPLAGERRAMVSLRPALVFTTGPRRHDRQFLSFIHSACREGRDFVFDSEEALQTYGCSFIGEKDMARATVDALELEESQAFNIGGGFCLWRDLVDAMNRAIGTESKCFVASAAGSDGEEAIRLPQSRTELDTSAFRDSSGFEPTESIEELVDRFVAEESRARTG